MRDARDQMFVMPAYPARACLPGEQLNTANVTIETFGPIQVSDTGQNPMPSQSFSATAEEFW